MRPLHSIKRPYNRHILWYTDSLPALIPIFLLGSAVYLGLQLTHLQIAHEKYMHDASQQVKQLEAEIQALQTGRAKDTSPREEGDRL